MIVWELEVDVIEKRSRWVDWSTPSLPRELLLLDRSLLLPSFLRSGVERFLIRRTFRLRHSILVQRSGRTRGRTDERVTRPDTAPPAEQGRKGMLHIRVQLVSVVIGRTILPPPTPTPPYARERRGRKVELSAQRMFGYHKSQKRFQKV